MGDVLMDTEHATTPVDEYKEKEFAVTFPIVGYATVYVEAPNEEIAKAIALADGATKEEIEDWYCYREITVDDIADFPTRETTVRELV